MFYQTNLIVGFKFFLFLWIFGSTNLEVTGQDSKSSRNVVSFYQKHISPIKNSSCLMYPSCSDFAGQCLDTFTVWTSVGLVTDRLIRCGHDRKFYPTIIGSSSYHSFDPVLSETRTPTQVISYRYFEYGQNRPINDCMDFVKNLINGQEYNAALLELLRMDYQGLVCDSVQWSLNLINVYRELDRHEDALFLLSKMEGFVVRNNDYYLHRAVGHIHFDLENFKQALQSYNCAKNVADTDVQKAEVIRFLSSVSVNLEDFEKAEFYLNELSISDSNELRNATLKLSDARKAFNKRKGRAQLLGVFPGAGYLYTGHWQSALSAFFLNSSFAYLTYVGIKEKIAPLAILSSAITMSFYLGSIKGAGRTVGVKRRSAYRSYNQYIINLTI